MGFLLLLVLVAAGAFSWLAYKHGVSTAVAIVVSAGAAVWASFYAALSGVLDKF